VPGDGIAGACCGVCDVLVHDGCDGAVPQLLGGERSAGWDAGDALSEESGHHGRVADAGIQRAGKMGMGATRGILKQRVLQIGCYSSVSIVF
jgi:hypothetical protein